MGQSVNSQLGTGALGYGVDPDFLRSQILQQREKGFQQIQNPFQQAAARLGTILGGGISNLANDRGFFDVSDPLLTKVTQIQGIYNQVAQQVDPNADPEKFFSTLQKAYAEQGMGQQALMAAQEGQKAKVTGMDIQLKETQLFEKNPELLAGRITSALESGNEAEANRLANLNARLTQDRELTLEAKKTAIAKDRAYISYQNKLASDEKFEYKPVDPSNPLAGNWKFDKSGKTDPQYVPVPAELAAKFAPPSKDAKKSDKEKAPLNTFETNTTTPPAAPATSSAAVPAAPVAAPPADMSAYNPAAYNQNAGTYRLDADPIIKMISDYAGQNRKLLETDPEFAKSITAAYENRKQELSRLMGTGVRFQ
jgi:hypothetical protein